MISRNKRPFSASCRGAACSEASGAIIIDLAASQFRRTRLPATSDRVEVAVSGARHGLRGAMGERAAGPPYFYIVAPIADGAERTRADANVRRAESDR
jgi:hypothetical protein